MSWLERLFTPVSVKRVRHRGRGGGFIGYMKVYIFGIRVAKIQVTSPWESY